MARSFGPAIVDSERVSEKQEGVVIRDFVKSIPLQKARYIRIRAVNLRAEGEWIFVDEISLTVATDIVQICYP